MGTWGPQPFEDDKAQDWVWDLTEAPDPVGFLRETLTTAVRTDYPSYKEGVTALAAAELVGALAGDTPAYLPERAEQWLETANVGDPCDLLHLAVLASDAVMTSSEVLDLRVESNSVEDWLRNATELNGRLRALTVSRNCG
jgi:hypothetical protein